MKKLFPVMAIALGAALFTSCKKDYNCTCTTTDNGTVIGTSTVSLGKQKKSDAENACSAKASSSGGGTTITTSCKLD